MNSGRSTRRIVGRAVSLIELRRGEHTIRALSGRVDTWVGNVLRPYIAEVPSSPYKRSKDIHDTVWGTVFLEPWELYCLDSPLLQRLRYIRQLGVAHFLFPSTGYSRFEHTIGSLEQAERIFRSLAVSSSARAPSLTEDDNRYALRLAALFHDVGHCALSHVTEKFYRLHPEVAEATEIAGDHYGRSISSSELLSLLIISSPGVHELLNRAEIGIRRAPRGDDLVEFMANCITGSVAQAFPNAFIAQILNGTIDCDKLDYLARDSRMAGTPVMLDAQRLQAKLRVVAVEDILRHEQTHILAIDVSGARALEEMLASRVFLYDKLYFHHKVQAAEELVRRALREVESELAEVADPAFLLQFSDEQLLDLAHPKFNRNSDAISRASNLLERVRYRRLPRRTFAFAPRFLLPAPEFITRLYTDESTAQADVDVRRGKVKTKRTLAGLEYDHSRLALAEEIRNRAVELGEVNAQTFVAWPKATSVVGGGDIAAVDADGNVWPADVMFAANKWVDAYSTSKQTGYVFALSPSPRLFLASERAFGDRGVWMNDRALTFSKTKRSEVDAERNRLVADHADDEGWIRHRLPPTWLDEASAKGRIEAVSEEYAASLGAIGISSRQWLYSWLWQFPDADLQESALRIAENFHVYGRAERAKLIQQHIDLIGRGGAWCYFSAPEGRRAKSAEMLGYYLKDLGPNHPEPRKLTEYSPDEIRNRGMIRFFDDCSCTGAQAVSLLGSWFGREDLVRSPRDAAEPLPDPLREAILQVPVHVFFCVSRGSAVDAVTTAGRELGLDLHVHVGEDYEAAKYTLNSVAFATPASERRIRTFLQNQGEALLEHRRMDPQHPWTGDQIRSFALGYDGAAALFGFEYSVASAIVTALWEGRYHAPDPWLPLVPRYPNEVAKRFSPEQIGRGDLAEPPPLDPASDV